MNDMMASSRLLFSLRQIQCLKDTETHSEYVVDNLVHSNSSLGVLFHLPVMNQVNQVQVNHFFHAIEDVDSRFDLSHNMLVMARLLERNDSKADGIADPDKWLIVRAERGSYVFFTGLVDLHPLEA